VSRKATDRPQGECSRVRCIIHSVLMISKFTLMQAGARRYLHQCFGKHIWMMKVGRSGLAIKQTFRTPGRTSTFAGRADVRDARSHVRF